MSQPQEPREVFPVTIFDGRTPVPQGKDFSIRPMAASTPVADIEVEAVVEETGSDPKDFSATGSAEFSDLIPSAAEAIPVDAAMDLEPTPTDLSKPTSSTSPAIGKSEPLADPAPATTPTTGSAKPAKRATAPRPSVSSAL